MGAHEGWLRLVRPPERAAAAAGACTSRAGTPSTKRRRIPSATSSSPRAKARVRASRLRGRPSPGAAASKIGSTRSAQSAAHAATARRSASLSVCGERIRQSCQPRAAMMNACFAKPPTEAVRSVAAADRAMMLVVPIAGHVRKRHRMCHTESSKGPFVDGSRADAAVRVAERLRRSAKDRGRTPLADRRRLRGTTMSAWSSRG
jgi:hypothetical protein